MRILFKGRQFTAEVILWAVRWYLQFAINRRDLEQLLADRGVTVDHTARRTIAGYEIVAMVRTGPAAAIPANDMTAQDTFIANLFGVAA